MAQVVSWYHPNVLDFGLEYLRANAQALHVCSGFDPVTDTRGSVLARSLGNTAYTVALGSIPAIINHTPDGRKISALNFQMLMTGSLGAGAGDVKLVLVSAAIVLAVTNEETERAIASGETIQFPGPTWILRQPPQ